MRLGWYNDKNVYFFFLTDFFLTGVETMPAASKKAIAAFFVRDALVVAFLIASTCS
jgi:hypothetical protein